MSDRTFVKIERLGGLRSLRAWSSAALIAAATSGASSAQAQDEKLPSGPNPYAEPGAPEPPGTAQPPPVSEPVQGADGSVSATTSIGGAAFPGTAPDQVDEPSDYRAHRVPTAMVVLGGGLELGGRDFHYSLSPANTANVRPHEIFPAPLIWLGGELYPAAMTDVPFVRDLGIEVGYAVAVGVDATSSDGRTFGTSWNRLLVGLRYRIRTSDAEGSMIGLGFGYGRTAFAVEPEDEAATSIAGEVATVDYEYLRLAGDLRIPIGPVSLLADVAYLAVVSAGEVYERFTPANRGTQGDASIGGVQLAAGLGIELTAGVELTAVFDYYRFFYAFSPEPGDQYVAGGALDQIFGVRFGVQYAY
jgi:hypothetical protein